MKRTNLRIVRLTAVLVTLLLCGGVLPAVAAIEGITGDLVGGERVFDLGAKCDFITTADGNSVLIWGYSDESTGGRNQAQYPGPTLLVNAGETVRINLTNLLTDAVGNPINTTAYDDKVSMLFPGHKVSATGGVPGTLANEVAYGETVSYTFTASQPGTHTYYSGSESWLQTELGLFGALIVRPNATVKKAYWDNGTNDAAFDRQYLFLLSEMDPHVHDHVEFEQREQINNSEYLPVYWFINGRAAPDTLMNPGVEWLPTQPYSALALMEPGERILMRVINNSRDIHPLHHHGNHARTIAQDGRLLRSTGGTGADISFEEFTIAINPGQTVDAIFEWTGKEAGWDLYGHSAGDGSVCNDVMENRAGLAAAPEVAQYGCNTDCYDDTTWEWCPDHEKGIPVDLPSNKDLAFGGFWSGSPYLGNAGALPPGEGGLNPWSGYFHIWHSHTEKELANFDIFPGGMLTFCAVVPQGTLAAE